MSIDAECAAAWLHHFESDGELWANEAERPSYLTDYGGEEWIRFIYDTGATSTALPVALAQDVKLTPVGHFNVASGARVPNYGRVEIPIRDEQGYLHPLQGSVTEVVKPLGSGNELARYHDSYIWDTGGVVIPRGGPVSRGLEREYNRLVSAYGTKGHIALHKEGSLYHYYVKKVGGAKRVGELSPLVTDCGSPGFARPVHP